MRLSQFDYTLPKELIAQEPFRPRDRCKLMIVKRGDNLEGVQWEHRKFSEIIYYLNPNDLLVFNNTKVLPARIYGKKEKTGGVVEVLLLKEIKKELWECLIRPSQRVRLGTKIVFANGELTAEVGERKEGGVWELKFNCADDFFSVIKKIGRLPLPPYIHRKLKREDDYQTIFAKIDGSVAAPTAGLHFTQRLIKQIKDKGVKIAFITLHINLDTFRPVKEEDITQHRMYSEFYQIPQETAEIINYTKDKGGRVIAVGTTTVRAIESAAIKIKHTFKVEGKEGWTTLFIYPDYQFKMVDALLTNFHFPKSSLLILTCAFAGRDNIFKAYEEAIKKRYRFYSFGDAMLII